jgi:nitrous oxide reductase accessory protein NosL
MKKVLQQKEGSRSERRLLTTAQSGMIGIVALLVVLAVTASTVCGAGPAILKTGPKDKCPVCGMFVSKYPDFAAQIRFRNGQVVHFDGAKDMFKYYLDLPRYAPGRKAADIAAVFVTDYYTLTPVDGLKASYVMGSNVYGPMGRELVPFADAAKAGSFLKDHQGKSIVRFRDVTPAMLKGLD